jgi:hypothetical protein
MSTRSRIDLVLQLSVGKLTHLGLKCRGP